MSEKYNGLIDINRELLINCLYECFPDSQITKDIIRKNYVESIRLKGLPRIPVTWDSWNIDFGEACKITKKVEVDKILLQIFAPNTEKGVKAREEYVDYIYEIVEKHKLKIKVEITHFIDSTLDTTNIDKLSKDTLINSIILKWNRADVIKPILFKSTHSQDYVNKVISQYLGVLNVYNQLKKPIVSIEFFYKINKILEEWNLLNNINNNISNKELNQEKETPEILVSSETADKVDNKKLEQILFEDYLRQLINERDIIEKFYLYCKKNVNTYFKEGNSIIYPIIINSEIKGEIYLSAEEAHTFSMKNNTVGYRQLYNKIYNMILECLKESYKDRLEYFKQLVSKVNNGEVLSFSPFKPHELDSNSSTEHKENPNPIAQRAIELEEEFKTYFPEIKNPSVTIKFPTELQDIITKLTGSKPLSEFKLQPFTLEPVKNIPKCEVFDPVKEMRDLKSQIDNLFTEVNKLKDSISNCGTIPTFGK